MITYKYFSLLLMLSVAKSEMDFQTVCKNDYRNMSNNQIDVLNYCSSNICIEKCCGDGGILAPKGCVNAKNFFKRFTKIAYLSDQVDYSGILLYSWDGYTKKVSNKDFVFVQNHRLLNNCTSQHIITNEFDILEDGSIRMQDTHGSQSWSVINRLEYCIDFKLSVINRKPILKLVVREYNEDPKGDDAYSTFVLAGMLISSFFLVLVLVVYCLLPELQNLIGLVLMANTLTILITLLLKIVLHQSIESLTRRHCKIISPLLYFAAVSSFFWWNVMSFDVWWSLRGYSKSYETDRRGVWVKFMWYCMYAWGVPLVVTTIVTILDNIDLSNLDFIKPPFDDCFSYAESVEIYFIIPIGVLVFVNIIMFLLTVYNIWMVRKAVHRSLDSESSTQDTNRIAIYIKLSVVMGIPISCTSWSLELVPQSQGLWVFILISSCQLFIGVAIFFLFIFNKRIFTMLCKR